MNLSEVFAPRLPESDISCYKEIEVHKGSPCDATDARLAVRRWGFGGGGRPGPYLNWSG